MVLFYFSYDNDGIILATPNNWTACMLLPHTLSNVCNDEQQMSIR